MSRTGTRIHRVACAIGVASVLLAAAAVPPPEDVAGGIAAALDSVRLVALGENHGHAEFHALLISLLEDPRIQRRVDDIAVEFGNALYQDVIDRYVAGEPVPRDSVRMVWRNTIVSPNAVWDSPVYEAFYDAVRRINAERTDGRSYRVVLGDSPVEWAAVASREDLSPFFDRPAHIAATVAGEILDRGRRGLLVAGGAHLTRVSMALPNAAGERVEQRSVVARLAARFPGDLYVIRSLGKTGDVDLGPVTPAAGPALLPTTDPRLATLEADAVSTMRNMDGTPFDGYGDATLADLVDAVIVWGETQKTFSEPAPPDRAYRVELDRRLAILRG